MIKVILFAASIAASPFAFSSIANADVYVKQLNRGSSVHVRQLTGRTVMIPSQATQRTPQQNLARRRQKAAATARTTRVSAPANPGPQLRINDFSQTGAKQVWRVPSVRGGVRIVPEN